MDEMKKVIGHRLREAREKHGLRQKEVAQKAGFPAHQIISQIESGNRDIKAWELAALAKVLKANVLDLLMDTEPLEAPMLWRENPGDSALEAELGFRKKCHDYWFVEQASGAKSGLQLPTYDEPVTEMSDADVDRLARKVSKEMDLGTRPASCLVHVLENKYHVKIWYADLDDGSAATIWSDFGPAILMNANQAPWRRNFNFAHELFHLITWDSDAAPEWKEDEATWKQVERLANKFASHLLLPADELSDEFQEYTEDSQISYASLVEIARNFEVSTSALFWRSVSLKWVDREIVEKTLESEEFKAIDRKSMPGLWETPSELPERYVRLAFSAYMQGKLSRARLAELMDTSLFDLSDELRKYGLNEEADYEARITVT